MRLETALALTHKTPEAKRVIKQAKEVCAKKRAYPTEAMALLAKFKYDRLYQKTSTPYSCPICNKWHLTTQVTRQLPADKDSNMFNHRYLLPAKLLLSMVSTGPSTQPKNYFVLAMPEGCRYAGSTFIVPTPCIMTSSSLTQMILLISDGWRFKLRDSDGKDVAELDITAFEDELRHAFENKRIADPYCVEEIERFIASYEKQLDGNGSPSCPASTGYQTNNVNTQDAYNLPTEEMPMKFATSESSFINAVFKPRVISYHNQFPDLTYAEIARLVGVSETLVENILSGAFSESADAVGAEAALRLSQVCEEIIATRNLLNEVFADVSASELLKQLKKSNQLLSIVASVLVAKEHPDYKVSKQHASELHDMLSAAQS